MADPWTPIAPPADGWTDTANIGHGHFSEEAFAIEAYHCGAGEVNWTVLAPPASTWAEVSHAS